MSFCVQFLMFNKLFKTVCSGDHQNFKDSSPTFPMLKYLRGRIDVFRRLKISSIITYIPCNSLLFLCVNGDNRVVN